MGAKNKLVCGFCGLNSGDGEQGTIQCVPLVSITNSYQNPSALEKEEALFPG